VNYRFEIIEYEHYPIFILYMKNNDKDLYELEKRIKILENELNCQNLESRIKILEKELLHIKKSIQYQLKKKKIE